jgi:flagellar L-ring protein precursor FlgH
MNVRYLIGPALILCAGAHGDSLFSRQVAEHGTLISEDRMRFKPGDMITVMVRENVNATADSQLDTEKKSKIDIKSPEGDNASLTGGWVDLNPAKLPNVGIDVKNKHESDGSTMRKNQVVFTVACTVKRVLPNGNVELQGEKRITVNRDDSLIKLTGVARTNDVTAQNTIDSNLLADAQVELKGQGPMWNNQRRGLLTRFLDWFSPF